MTTNEMGIGGRNKDDARVGLLVQAAKRLIASDEAYARAREAMDNAVAESATARVEIIGAMDAAGIRQFTLGDILFERDLDTVHWTRLDAVLPDDRTWEC